MIRNFGTITGLTNQPQGLDTGAGINTSDATALVADILSGKTAYVKDVKLTGTGVAGKGYAEGTVTADASANFTTPILAFRPSLAIATLQSTSVNWKTAVRVNFRDISPFWDGVPAAFRNGLVLLISPSNVVTAQLQVSTGVTWNANNSISMSLAENGNTKWFAYE